MVVLLCLHESIYQDGTILFYLTAHLMCFTRHSPDTADEHTLLIVVDAAQKDLGTMASDQVHAIPTLGLTQRSVHSCNWRSLEEYRAGLGRRTPAFSA